MELSTSILSDIVVFLKYAKFISGLGRRESWEELVSRNKDMHLKRYPELSEKIVAAARARAFNSPWSCTSLTLIVARLQN